LILENSTEGKTGVPILKDIPLFGALFSTTTEDVFRTELLVTVKPQVITNDREMQKVTDELRRQMSKANEYEQAIRGERASTE